ncbi:MAG: serine hydrolase domain-containing protein, partial [Oscillospiraceae bacterium]|nr:serine hydrolase domain-containing protein [Oscillospiraceae bacterium]
VTASLDLLGGKQKVGDFRYAPVIGIDILSGILVNTTGRSVLSFAQEHLFSPLEISVENNIFFDTKEDQMHFYKQKGMNGWVVDPKGTNTAGWGLSLTAMDMAKLGLLYLQQGRWNGQQLVSQTWVSESTKTQSVWEKCGLKYGYLWWVIDEMEHSFAALGDGGNAIYVNPKYNIVVALSSVFAPRVKDRIDFIKNDIEPLFQGGCV